ncbi:MAG: M10 family metallopeptidase [Pseudomonadota bacterium]
MPGKAWRGTVLPGRCRWPGRALMCNYCTLLVNETTSLNGHVGDGAPVVVTYSFATAADLAGTRYTPADSTLRQNVRLATDAAEAAGGLRFVEVGPGADTMMRFYYNDDKNGVSWAYFPSSSPVDPNTSSDIGMNAFYGDYAPGSGGFQIILHEIGHAMGLKHPHDGRNTLSRGLDGTDNTVMSYVWRGAPKDDYQALDKAAIRALYGASSAFDGVTTTFHNASKTMRIEGNSKDNVLLGVNDDNYIEGRMGADTLVGRMGNDTLMGNFGSDRLEGFDGNDKLVGGYRSDPSPLASWQPTASAAPSC